MTRLVVYVGASEGYTAAKRVLEGVAEVCHVKAETEILEVALKKADALLDASMKVRITNEMLANAENLVIISCATTGSDHIFRKVGIEQKVEIRTLKENSDLLSNLTPAAELSWALLMACARKLKGALHHVTEGNWVREDFPGVMLNGKKLGLIGCGRIGGWMARYAQAFGMEVIGYDPYLAIVPSPIKKVSIDEVFKYSDFISIHVHLSSETENLVSRELLQLTKKGVILINTSRGQIVDEGALLVGLKNGHIAAAGLDVITGEPDIRNHPLVVYSRDNDNLLITPHCGGFSPDAVKLVCAKAAEKIKIKLMEAKK